HRNRRRTGHRSGEVAEHQAPAQSRGGRLSGSAALIAECGLRITDWLKSVRLSHRSHPSQMSQTSHLKFPRLAAIDVSSRSTQEDLHPCRTTLSPSAKPW